MSRYLVLFAVLLSLSFNAEAARKKRKKAKRIPKKPAITQTAEFVTEDRMRVIDLRGLAIVNVDGQNEFHYPLKLAPKLDKQTQAFIAQYTQNRIVSRVFELGGRSAFQNVYVFVMENQDATDLKYYPASKYILNVLYVSRSYYGTASTAYASRYYITRGDAKNLTVYRYKKDSARVVKTGESLFPFERNISSTKK